MHNFKKNKMPIEGKIYNLDQNQADQLIPTPPTDESVEIVRLLNGAEGSGYYGKRSDGTYEAIGGSGMGFISGGGNLNRIPKFTPDGTHIGNSMVFDNGTSIGVNTIVPSSKALLDLNSNNKGILIPRLTNLQRNNIVSPDNSLLIYNSDTKQFNYYNGTSWIVIESSMIGFTNGGNSFGANATLGLNDNFDLTVITNAASNTVFKKSGNVLMLNNLSIGSEDTMIINGNPYPSRIGVNSDTLALCEFHVATDNPGASSVYYGARSRNTQAAPAILQNGDFMATFAGIGWDGTDFSLGGTMSFVVDGIPADNVMPTKLVLSLSPAGSENPNDVFVVFSNGLIGAGSQAGVSNGSLSIGFNSGGMVAARNTFVGIQSGQNNVSGISNTFIGFASGASITTGFSNAFLGTSSGQNTSTGFQNTAIGFGALETGNNINCTAIGHNALNVFNSGGDVNDSLGYNSLSNLTSGNGNVAIGSTSLLGIATGQNNTGIGQNSGAGLNLNSSNNTYVGYYSGYGNGAYTGNLNLAIGSQANFTSKGSFNTILGTQSALNNDGSSNVFIGFSSGKNQTVASNTFIIDNTDRGSAVNELANSLIYGTFDAAVANQYLKFNAQKINLSALPTGSAGVASGELYVDTAANILANGDLVVARKS